METGRLIATQACALLDWIVNKHRVMSPAVVQQSPPGVGGTPSKLAERLRQEFQTFSHTDFSPAIVMWEQVHGTAMTFPRERRGPISSTSASHSGDPGSNIDSEKSIQGNSCL